MESPTQVRYAVAALWISLGLITVQVAASQILSRHGGLDLASWAWLVAATAIEAWLIYLTSHRKNWARIVISGLSALSIAAGVLGYAYFPEAIANDPWWSNLLYIGNEVAEIAAIIWLFSRPSNQWFGRLEVKGAF